MAEFGTPQRSATSDANAGMVNPPAKQHVARNAVGTSNKKLSGSDKAFDVLGQAVGSQLGTALSSMITDQTAGINEQRVIDAAARQGIDTAMNEVDQVKKRTGWEKAVFGENIEYRAAQQRAVQNKVQASYLEDLAGIDGYAGHTPQQYHEIQKTKNEAILAEYKDDPDTRSKIQAALAASGQKLATAQYKSHYANNQLQQQEVDRVSIQQTFDGFNLEAPTLMTLDAQQAQLKDIKAFLSGSTKREGKTNMAHRAQILDVVKTNMKAGNAGPMLAIQALGMDTHFSAAEQQQWDVALDAYDSDFSQKADLIRTNADIQMETAVTPEQVDAAVNQKNKDLGDLFKRSSGSQRSSLIMARGNLDMSKDTTMVAKQAQARVDALATAANKAVEETDKAIIASIGIASENMKQAIDLAVTPEEKQVAITAYNAEVAQLVQGLTPEVANILKKEKLDTAATTAKQALIKEQQKAQLAAQKKKDELAEQASIDAAVADYFSTPDKEHKAAVDRDFDLTKKMKTDGLDTHLVKLSQKFIGGDTLPTSEEFAKELQTNPKLQAVVLQEMVRNKEISSPMLTTILSGALGAPERLFDVDGNVTDVGKQTVAMVDKMIQADKGVVLIGGKDKAVQWQLLSKLVNSGAGKLNVEQTLQGYNDNKGKADTSGFRWKDATGSTDTSVEDWMTAKFDKLKIKPTRQMVTDSITDFKQYLVAFGYDVDEANTAWYRQMTNNKTMVLGSMIPNGSHLNDITADYSAEDLITAGDKYGLMTNNYQMIRGKDAPTTRSHRGVKGLKVYTKDGHDGMFMSSPSTSFEVHMSPQDMRDMARDINRIKDQRQVEEKLIRRQRAKYHGLHEKLGQHGISGGTY